MNADGKIVSTDSHITEWDQRAAGFEVVACTEHWMRMPELLAEQMKSMLPASFSPEQQLLFISFDGLMDRRYNAFLLTHDQQAVVCYEADGDLCDEFIGTMSLSDFWAFLDSFPNVYRHLGESLS